MLDIPVPALKKKDRKNRHHSHLDFTLVSRVADASGGCTFFFECMLDGPRRGLLSFSSVTWEKKSRGERIRPDLSVVLLCGLSGAKKNSSESNPSMRSRRAFFLFCLCNAEVCAQWIPSETSLPHERCEVSGIGVGDRVEITKGAKLLDAVMEIVNLVRAPGIFFLCCCALVKNVVDV